MSDYRKMSIWKDDPLPTVVTAFSFVAAFGFIAGFFTAYAVM